MSSSAYWDLVGIVTWVITRDEVMVKNALAWVEQDKRNKESRLTLPAALLAAREWADRNNVSHTSRDMAIAPIIDAHGAGKLVLIGCLGQNQTPEVIPEYALVGFSTAFTQEGVGAYLADVSRPNGPHWHHISAKAEQVRAAFPSLHAEVRAEVVEKPSVDEQALGRWYGTGYKEAMDRLATAELLRDCAYRVVESHDAQAAIEVLSSGELVDVVFSDAIMPGSINGFEFAAWVHAHYPRVPVMLTSGYSNQRLIVEFQKYGTFMVKPYSYDALLANIERLMNQSASQ
jgi:CheY-like chemotaxis protein